MLLLEQNRQKTPVRPERHGVVGSVPPAQPDWVCSHSDCPAGQPTAASTQARTSIVPFDLRQKPGLRGSALRVLPGDVQLVPTGHGKQSTPSVVLWLLKYRTSHRHCDKLVALGPRVMARSGHWRHADWLLALVVGL